MQIVVKKVKTSGLPPRFAELKEEPSSITTVKAGSLSPAFTMSSTNLSSFVQPVKNAPQSVKRNNTLLILFQPDGVWIIRVGYTVYNEVSGTFWIDDFWIAAHGKGYLLKKDATP